MRQPRQALGKHKMDTDILDIYRPQLTPLVPSTNIHDMNHVTPWPPTSFLDASTNKHLCCLSSGSQWWRAGGKASLWLVASESAAFLFKTCFLVWKLLTKCAPLRFLFSRAARGHKSSSFLLFFLNFRCFSPLSLFDNISFFWPENDVEKKLWPRYCVVSRAAREGNRRSGCTFF